MLKGWIRGVALIVGALAAACTWTDVAAAGVTSASRHVPLPAGLAAGGLDGVSCAGDQFCVGVGSARPKHGAWVALVERWNGTSWKPMRPAGGKPKPTELYEVDCHSRSDCVAVGYASTKRGWTSVVERWNGTSWTEMKIPEPKHQSESALGGVSCPASNWCMAVGYSANANGLSHALVERYNGATWSMMRIDHWGGASDNALLDVSCPSTHACFAVGLTNGGEGALIQHWNGRTWSPTVLNDDDYSGLGGIYCQSARHCLAAGGLGDSGGDWTYLEQWDGRSWGTIDAATYNEGQLYGVACSRRVVFCVAVGQNVETWTGGSNWSDRGLASLTLEGVACAKRMCMAVGEVGDTKESPASLLIRDQ